MQPVALAVEAPPSAECVSAESLRASVEERVGTPIVAPSPGVVRLVSVRIAASARGYAAEIRLTDAKGKTLGERTVSSDGPACGDLERPLLLVVSTLVGIAGDEPPEPAPAEEPPPEPPPRAPAPRPELPEPVSDRPLPAEPAEPPEPFRFGLALLGGAESGFLPGIAPLVSGRFLARRGWLELRAGGGVAPWAERRLGGPATATFRSAFGDLDLCAASATSAATGFQFCAGARAGAILARASGLYENVTAVRAFVAATVRVSFQISPFAHHALLLEVGGAVPVIPQTYVFIERDSQETNIHTVDLGAFGEVGWAVRFGS